MKSLIMRSESISFTIFKGGLIYSNRKRASISLPPPTISSLDVYTICPDWQMKITSDLSEAPEERFFGCRGFSAEYFLGPEDIEDDAEFEEVDSISYYLSPLHYMQIFISLVQVLEHFQRWRAIETFFNLLQIVLFLVLLLLT